MSDQGYLLKESDLLPLALGAAVLGTGGGGNPYIGMLLAREELRRGASVRILPLASLDDEAYIGAVGGIGAPVVGVEKLKEGRECLRALRAVEAAHGASAVALISEEIGGANALAPIITAAQAGLPVVDGDGMGRAFPEVQMSSFFIYGQSPAPAAIADDKGNVLVFREIVDMFWLERFARHAAVDMGAGAGFATSLMTGRFLKQTAVPGTVTQAIEIGWTLLDARAKNDNVVDRLLLKTGASLLFTGRVVDVQRALTGGFVRGEVRLEGLGEDRGSIARIAIQNENLICLIDDRVAAVVPDLIMNLEISSGEPVTTEMLRYGQQLAVIGIPAHDLMKTEQALAVVGPGAFGYPDIPFTPLDWQGAGSRMTGLDAI